MLKNVGFAALLLFCVYGVFVENASSTATPKASYGKKRMLPETALDTADKDKMEKPLLPSKEKASAVKCTTAGQGNVVGTCTDCPKGTWSNGADSTNTTCDKCPDGKTTIGTNSTKVEDCNVAVCQPGQTVTDRKCTDCPFDTYLVIDNVNNTTTCVNCSENTGTKKEGSTSSDDCIPFCTAGKGLVNDTCEECSIGTWNNGNDTMRFEKCTNCTADQTSKSKGATRESDCKAFCTAGKGLVKGACVECSEGTWNNGDNTMKFKECTHCIAGKTTKSKGATSEKNCTSTVAISNNKKPDNSSQHSNINKKTTTKTSSHNKISTKHPKAQKATTSTTTAPTTSTTADPITVETLVKFDPKTLGTFLKGTSKELTVAGGGQDKYIHFDPTNATKPVELNVYDKPKNAPKDPKATKTTVTFQYKVGEGVDVKLMYNNKTMWTSTNGTTKNWTNETYIVTNEIASKIYFVMTKNNKTMDPKNGAGFDVKGFDVKRKTTHRTTTTATVTAPSTADPITVETLVKFEPKTMNTLVNGIPELTVDGSGKDSYIHFDPTNAKKPVELNVFDKPKDKTKNANATETTVTFKYKVGEGVDVNLVYNGKTIWTKNITSKSWQNASVNVPGDIASKIKFVLTKNNKTFDPNDVVGFDVKDIKVLETTDHSKSKGSKPPPPTPKSDKNNGGLSTTTIVAIAVPIAVVVLLVVVLVVYKVCFKKNKVSVDKHGGKEASGSSATNVSDTVPMHSRNSNP